MRLIVVIWFVLASAAIAQPPPPAIESPFEKPPAPAPSHYNKPHDRELRTHLVSEHQMDVDGLSESEMESLHDSLHRDLETLRPNGVKSYIVMETEPWCGPCQRWKSEVKPALVAAGWKIVELPVDIKRKWQPKRKANSSIPAFFVVIGNVHYGHVGYMSMDRLRDFVSQARR